MSTSFVSDIISQYTDYCENKGWTRREDFIKHIPNRGRGLITNDTEAACYIAAYGDSHLKKLEGLFDGWNYDMLDCDFEIFDWGCGQGLATLAFMEKAPFEVLLKLRKITLIDKSQFILDKAERYVRDEYKYLIGAWASFHDMDRYAIEKKHRMCIEKKCDSLPMNDGSGLQQITVHQKKVVHLFSNVLDIPGINLKALTDEIVQSNVEGIENYRNYVLATHPGTDNVDSGGVRMQQFIHQIGSYSGIWDVKENDGYLDNGKYWSHLFGYAECQGLTKAYCDYMSEGADGYEESQQMSNYIDKYPESDPLNDNRYVIGRQLMDMGDQLEGIKIRAEKIDDFWLVREKKRRTRRKKTLIITSVCLIIPTIVALWRGWDYFGFVFSITGSVLVFYLFSIISSEYN